MVYYVTYNTDLRILFKNTQNALKILNGLHSHESPANHSCHNTLSLEEAFRGWDIEGYTEQETGDFIISCDYIGTDNHLEFLIEKLSSLMEDTLINMSDEDNYRSRNLAILGGMLTIKTSTYAY